MISREDSVLWQISCLEYSYHNQSVFSGLEWEFREGSTFSLIGPTGSGKTTFLKLLAGLIMSGGDKVFFRGKPYSHFTSSDWKAFRLEVAMTFQKDGLFDSLTCYQNLELPLLERTKDSAKERTKKIEEALEQVSLQGKSALAVSEMSGGMQKRLGIARALLFSPKVLLLDEPTAGLDPVTSEAITQCILSATDKYRFSLVVVSSDLHQAERLTEQVGFLWQGEIFEKGSWEMLRTSRKPETQQFLTGNPVGPLTKFTL
jgi:phospholipid/cholesterol/gamma-HCH transport system ATP-binding protein